jgi:alpha-glucan,water dikinase
MVETLQHGTASQLDNGLHVTQRIEGDTLTLTIQIENPADCVLHWGVSRNPGGLWARPAESSWPHGTTPADGAALRTPFTPNGDGRKVVTIPLDASAPWRGLAFVVHTPKDNRWIKSGGRDYVVPLLRQRGAAPEEKLAAWAPEEDCARQTIALDSGDRLAAAVRETPEGVYVRLACDAAGPLFLHWGLAWRFHQEWRLPPEECRPAGTSVADDKAAHTPFAEHDGLRYLELHIPRPAEGAGPRGLRFVLQQAEDGWLKQEGKDIYLPLFKGAVDARLASPQVSGLAEQIVGAEKGAGSWTLMHRFNLCHDLLAQAQDDADALALLFAWLRYSAIRQLDWQRRYNTKPRELSHAQDRLTARLAGIWRSHPAGSGCRFWARQMLTTLGRGGEGQRVRDEILHIMHRNHLKEMAGNFIEEWHQKLHNNTTPDDVVICQAYLAFLRSGGDVGLFYRTLEQGGVTRERLHSFERPIKTDPTFYGDKKDALIGEFEHFLSILKSVHSGTDLDSAIGAARGRLDGGLNHRLDGLLGLRGQGAAVGVLAEAAASAREALAAAMAATRDDAALRDMLFLDLALEEFLRGAVERQNVSQLGRDELADLVQTALRNLHITDDTAELAVCVGQWAALREQPRDGRDWALHARSITERAARWVQEFTTAIYQRLQPKAEALGAGFGAEGWTVPLFSEEVIRGGPAFTAVASAAAARPPAARGGRTGRLAGHQSRPRSRQGPRRQPSARRADRALRGTDRAGRRSTSAARRRSPEGATAVLTTDAPDLVSHVAVRARNAGVLFATCFDGDEYQRLKALAGKSAVTLRHTRRRCGIWRRGQGCSCRVGRACETHRGAWWVSFLDPPYDGVSGLGHRPGPIRAGHRRCQGEQPARPARARCRTGFICRAPSPCRSGSSKRCWSTSEIDGSARSMKRSWRQWMRTIPRRRWHRYGRVLGEIAAPPDLQAALQACWQRAGLPATPWEQTWHAVRRVWASKWNDRAFLSRRARGVPA